MNHLVEISNSAIERSSTITIQHSQENINNNDKFIYRYIYNRRGNDTTDRLYLIAFFFLLIFCGFYFFRQFFSYLLENGSVSIPKILMTIIGGGGAIILSLLLFPYGYGRLEIGINKICIIPARLVNLLPISMCFSLNKSTYISYYPDVGLIFFAQKHHEGKIYINGIKKDKINKILTRIKILSQNNRNIKFFLHE
jgi:hypothetical protein